MTSLKKIIAPILFCLPLFVAAQDEAIQWTSKKLTWDDYLAKPSETDEAAAVTSTGIGIEYIVRNNQLTYKITCLFSKNRSWGRFRSDYILAHEQGHFDITEIYARKLAKAVEEYEFNPKSFKSDLNSIYKKLMKEKEDYQELYDHQTDFSRDKTMQTCWLQKIQIELDDLEVWANYGYLAQNKP
jgi:predicted secreted Zn-dependent protease